MTGQANAARPVVVEQTQTTQRTHMRRTKPISQQYLKIVGALTEAVPHGVKVDHLRSLVWPDSAPANWRTIISIRVTRARKRDGHDIVCEKGMYRLLPAQAQAE